MDISELTGSSLGNYEIERILGKGGMGIVYKARQVSLNRMVALKVLYPDLARDASFVKRFHREALAVAQLDHKNIVQIYDIGEENGLHYFGMEYIKGQSLKEILAQKGFLNPATSLKIMAQAASALAHAHKFNVIHRDIKPSNIMVDQAGRVKVMDFGLAKVVSDMSEITQTGALLGTPKYMSPEQCRGEELDERSDIYSLGVVFYEMLTGKAPFSAPDNMSLMHKIIYESPPDIKALNPEVPRGLCDIVARAMSRNREKRYASARAFLKAVRGFQVQYNEGPEKLFEREQRQATWRKLRRVFGLLAVILAGSAIGFAVLKRQNLPPPPREGPSPLYDIRDYHPLSVGDQWVFRTSDGNVATRTVTGLDRVCGKKAVRMEYSDGLTFWAALDDAGWWQMKHRNPDGVTNVICTQEPVMDRVASAGYHKSVQFQNAPIYNATGEQIGEMTGACSTVFDKVETLTMPNGRQLECLHLLVSLTQFVNVGGGMSNVHSFEVWLAKGIGPVRRIDESGRVFTLERAVLNGTSYSFLETSAQSNETSSLRVSVPDPAGNLRGDTSKTFVDVVQADLTLDEATYTLTVHTAAPFPDPRQLENDKRVDVLLYIDIDRNMRGGKFGLGGDYTIHVFLDNTGWGWKWHKVTDTARTDGITLIKEDIELKSHRNMLSLSFPNSYLPSSSFDWWLNCGMHHKHDWTPIAENPPTVRKTFSALKAFDKEDFSRVFVRDPKGNLRGDRSRVYLDILQADLALGQGRYTLTVQTAGPFPEPATMANKRIDIICFVDIDRNIGTGQSSLGYEYLINLHLDGDGWNVGWNKTSDSSQKDGVPISPEDVQIEVEGANASLSFPKHYLPADLFDWWVYCGAPNAPNWPPTTQNPATARTTFAVTKAAR